MNKAIVMLAKITWLIVILLFPNFLYAEETLIFEEKFEGNNPLSQWSKIDSTIKIVKDTQGNHALMIQRDNKWAFTRVRKDFENVKGTIKVEATIQAKEIVPGEKSWHEGILQLMILDGEKEIGYKNDKFIGSFNPLRKEVIIEDLDGNYTVALRIGLQNAKGTMWVDDIKVYNIHVMCNFMYLQGRQIVNFSDRKDN